jgi:subtilisin family serine protease
VITAAGVIGYLIGLKSDQAAAPGTTAKGSLPASSRVPVGHAMSPPVTDPGALRPDGPPGPVVPMRQFSYCTKMDVLPDTDFRISPKFVDMLKLREAWKFGRGAGVKVAVIDTGVSPHPRLPHLVGGGDYVMDGGDGLSDCDGHGTLVASLIAGASAQTDAFSGVAPDVNVISIRQSSQAFGPTDPPSVDENPQTRQKLDSIQTMARAIVHAADMGAAVINVSDVLCMSARNDGLVNAVDGPDDSLLVPSGTGFSAAFVSGVAALVRAKYPQLSAHQIINRLIRTARTPTEGVNNQIGYGVVDPVAALTKEVG